VLFGNTIKPDSLKEKFQTNIWRCRTSAKDDWWHRGCLKIQKRVIEHID